MNPWNLTTTKLLSQQVAYPPHLFVEEIPSLGNSSVNKGVTKEPRGSQMTIFYDGQVIVFEDIQADKVKDIMSFASTGMSQNQNDYAYTFPATNSASSSGPFPFLMNIIPSTANNSVQEHPQAPSKPVIRGNSFRSLIFDKMGDLCLGLCISDPSLCVPFYSDLPMARKASLHRFLEKRKDRIAARAPYQASNPTAFPNKPAKSMPWLTLAPNSPQDESDSESNSSFVLF
ncbi:TIFY 10A [Spatholobus suberectus]|nr:TIFY 10A [Spatholobus suberectus]